MRLWAQHTRPRVLLAEERREGKEEEQKVWGRAFERPKVAAAKDATAGDEANSKIDDGANPNEGSTTNWCGWLTRWFSGSGSGQHPKQE